MNSIEIRHFHLFCGLGGGAKGFNSAHAEVGKLRAAFRCIGGVDVDKSAIADFDSLAGVKGTVLDLFDRSQYRAFHGHNPPKEWREATADDIRAAAGFENPHIVFLSAPCKGFSGLLSETRSKTGKYQALNRLTVRGVFLMLEAFKADLPELILFENVPRIENRGRHLLDQIVGLLRGYGYAVAEAKHDCGELGGLAQSRKRFLLVARNTAKVRPFLYEPEKRSLLSVGDVLGLLPMPGAEIAGPMHRVPSLQWKTWVRLAFVEAGSDWRSLNRLKVKKGMLADYCLLPLAGRPQAVANPIFEGQEYSQYGVRAWDKPAATVTSQRSPGQGPFSVADPRIDGTRHNNVFRVAKWSEPSPAVTGGGGPTAGGLAVADPRMCWGAERENYNGAGHYGVMSWGRHSWAVSAAAGHDNGPWSVADPRVDRLPISDEKCVAQIIAEDGSWHRPFTTLELAALQGLVDPEREFLLSGESDSAWRERIGNAVPPHAATAIASEMGRTLLLAWSGETFALGSTPIWVRNLAVALSVAQPQHQ